MATTVLSGTQKKVSKRFKHRKDKQIGDVGTADKTSRDDRLFSVNLKENDCPSGLTDILKKSETNSNSREVEVKCSRKKKRSGWKSIKKGASEFQQQSRKILNDMMTKVRQHSSKRRATVVENINITPDYEDSSDQWAATRRVSSLIESTQSIHSFVSMERCNSYESVAVVHDMEEEFD